MSPGARRLSTTTASGEITARLAVVDVVAREVELFDGRYCWDLIANCLHENLVAEQSCKGSHEEVRLTSLGSGFGMAAKAD